MGSTAAPMDTATFRQFLTGLAEEETATTLKLLNAYPVDRSELRPHQGGRTARELAWLFVLEQKLMIAAIEDTLDLSRDMPPPPETFGEVVDAFERTRDTVLERLRTVSEDRLNGTVRFPVAPKKVGDVPRLPFIHFLLRDQIHHRGQFSVYLRLAGARVPSIYGPTADEPWT